LRLNVVLIIPSIPIMHGLCGAQIAARAHETHFAEQDIYTQDPVDRVRLLRKENSKMINLQFVGSDPWDDAGLALLRRIREAVDIPLNISLADAPPSNAECHALLDAGVYRIFLPLDTPEEMFLSYCGRFTSRKVIPTVDLSFDFRNKLPIYREHRVERIAIDISPSDSLETNSAEWQRLTEFGEAAAELCIRLTVIHGIRGYRELKHLQELGPAYDSLILGRALNENRFPCQLIWREMEATAAFETTPASNLWTNPLAGKAHV
jgi:phosphoribosylformimino-5-aminoimidazole carboxamide ribotide isomerase